MKDKEAGCRISKTKLPLAKIAHRRHSNKEIAHYLLPNRQIK